MNNQEKLEYYKSIRIGEKKLDKYGVEMEIIDYTNTRNIKVRFNDEYGAVVSTRYDCYTDNRIKNPYRRSFYNIGYLGEGKYNCVKHKKAFECWENMIKRCYNDKDNKDITYKDCFVCDEWHNFQVFAKWYYDNYYKIDEQLFLDKDILFKHNKIYSPDTCVFVPRLINNLFTKRQNERGELPIGVRSYKNTNRYITIISETHRYGKTKRKHLAIKDTPNECFIVYKNYKENLIKQIADEYKDDIPYKLYEALYKYEVEITD